MPAASETLFRHLSALDNELGTLRLPPALSQPLDRWRSDAKAVLFHLNRDPSDAGAVPLLALLGGTGTGKSTLLNRLLGAKLSATSFRRTFTTGPVAVPADPNNIPPNYLAPSPHRPITPSTDQPARGETNTLTIVPHRHALTERLTLIDTPDLDGDHPAHHAEADRAFRWAEAILFLVTPEKYQMTELLPYYRLARRYGLPSVFVMNKVEEKAVFDDFVAQLASREHAGARVFAVPRDDAAYEPPADANLSALSAALANLPDEWRGQSSSDSRRVANRSRIADLLDRVRDQVLSPLARRRRAIDEVTAALRALTAPAVGVDVAPITHQLQRRLQEQSILYLMGPQRILDRVRQVPGLLARLPRATFDLLRGNPVKIEPATSGSANARAAPDFPTLLGDQFTLLHSRIDDLLRTTPLGAEVLDEQSGSASADPARDSLASAYTATKLPPSAAARIAEEELGALKAWLEQRWNATPRDTRAVQKFLNLLPGGRSLARWTEAAPYLLAVVSAATTTLSAGMDLVVIGSFTLATWLGEKLSNEVTSRTRQANTAIANRFAELARSQINQTCAFLDSLAPPTAHLARLQHLADELSEQLQ